MNAFQTVETNITINDSYNEAMKIDLHSLQWFIQGNEPGPYQGTKLGIPAGIDSLLGWASLTFAENRTLFW